MLDSITLPVAFIAGIMTFFASCLAPLTPTYIAYLAGISAEEIRNPALVKRRRGRIILNALFFVTGFVFVFVILGAGATSFGRLLVSERDFIQQLGGVFLLLVGLFMMGWLRWNWLFREFKLEIPRQLGSVGVWHSLLVGFTFGFAWTPCIGPILSVILFAASFDESRLMGMLLLLVFGLGLGLPFLALGLFFEYLSPWMRSVGTYGAVAQRISGLIIFLMGLMLLGGWMGYLTIDLTNLVGIETNTL